MSLFQTKREPGKAEWPSARTIMFLKSKAMPLVRNACRDGWHLRLHEFVSYKHRLPNADEIDDLVAEHMKIERMLETDNPAIFSKQKSLEGREKVKRMLLEPLEADKARSEV